MNEPCRRISDKIRVVHIGGVGASFFFFALSSAYADIYNRQILPLGEREAFMGNSGTGDAADTGAVYYNPAGLASMARAKVSVLGSSYLSFDTAASSVAQIQGTDVPYEAKGFNTIPSAYVITAKEGQIDLAFSVLIPESYEINNRATFSSANTSGTVIQSTATADLWIGLTAATQINSQWSIGLTFFGVKHDESSVIALIIDDNASSPSTFAALASRDSLSVFGLSAVFGVEYKATDWLSLGLRAQSPFLQFTGTGDTYRANRSTISGGSSAPDESQAGIPVKYELPLDFTLGSAFKLGANVELFLDLSLQCGSDFETIPNSGLGTHVSTEATFRGSAGIEIGAIPSFPIRMGFYFNPSAERNLTTNDASEGSLNYYGLTGGIVWKSEHVETGVGGFYIRGSGPFITASNTIASETNTGTGVILTTAYGF
jgi:hypothetical protein